jgi:hypothetical protein
MMLPCSPAFGKPVGVKIVQLANRPYLGHRSFEIILKANKMRDITLHINIPCPVIPISWLAN